MWNLSKSALVAMIISSTALATEGMVVTQSAFPVSETVNRLVTALESKGMTVFARIDHASGAAKAGATLAPTELVIFGNPKVGTPLMQCARSAAIDLPQKMLVWEDDDADVWLAYNDPAYLGTRHQITESCSDVLAKVATALGNFARAATAP